MFSLLTGAFFLAGQTVVAETIQWKFNNGLPETRNEARQLDLFAADVARLSNDSLAIKVFHGGPLNLKDNDIVCCLRAVPCSLGSAALATPCPTG